MMNIMNSVNMTRPPRATRSRRRDRAAGSAYVITLLALLVLTAIGLSLVIVTQTEVQIGGNERLVNRMAYAAEGGFAAATAKILVDRNYTPTAFSQTDSSLASMRIDIVAHPVPAQEGPCALCAINRAGSYGEREYVRQIAIIGVTAERRALNDTAPADPLNPAPGDTPPVAMARLTNMLHIEPWTRTPQEHNLSRVYDSAIKLPGQ